MQHAAVKHQFQEELEHYTQERQATDSHLIPLILQWLQKKHFKRKISICEFGGGAGQLLNEIRKSYSNVRLTNVEIIHGYRRFLVSGKINFVVGSVLNSSFPDESFDIIIMRNVMHHLVGENLQETLDNQRSSLKELKRLLRSGGVIFIEELTNTSEIVCRLIYFLTKLNSKVKLRFFNISPYAVVYFLTPNNLLELCQQVFEQQYKINKKIVKLKVDLISKYLHFGKKIQNILLIIEKQ